MHYFLQTISIQVNLITSFRCSERIFQIDEVWVDQKTLTISMKPGGWLNPHTVDCYSKMLNTDQLIRGRQGLIHISDVISHIVGREDMVLLFMLLLFHNMMQQLFLAILSDLQLNIFFWNTIWFQIHFEITTFLFETMQELLMRPMLNHSDPICRDMLSEQTVGFSLQNANL